MAEAGSRVRLFQKSIRVLQGKAGQGDKQKAKSTPAVTAVVSAKKALQRCAKDSKSLGTRDRKVRSPVHRRLKTIDVSMRAALSMGESVASSLEVSPRESMVTLEAINLELKLSETLTHAESLPSPERSSRRLQAYLDTLSAVSGMDSVYGEALRQVAKELNLALSTAQVSMVGELRMRRAQLSAMLMSLKTTAQSEKEYSQPRERLLETLNRENALLQQKCEELEALRRRGLRVNSNPGLISSLKEMTRKIKELDEEVRAARIRETKLTDLLTWMQADSARSEAYGTEDELPVFPAKQRDKLHPRPAVVPPLVIPATDCSPQVDSALNKAFEWSASTGTGVQKSPAETFPVTT